MAVTSYTGSWRVQMWAKSDEIALYLSPAVRPGQLGIPTWPQLPETALRLVERETLRAASKARRFPAFMKLVNIPPRRSIPLRFG